MRLGWLCFHCGPCKQSTISAYKCLQVTKLKPEDNQSQTANLLKLYLISNFLAVFHPFPKSLSLSSCLEKEMATHSSILTWKIPWTEEGGRLLSMGSQRVGRDWATSLELLLVEHSSSFLVWHYFKYIFAQICFSLSVNTTHWKLWAELMRERNLVNNIWIWLCNLHLFMQMVFSSL